MDKTKLNLTLFFAFMGIALYPLSWFYALIAGLIVVTLSQFYLKDKEITAKVLQPFIYTCSAIIINGVLTVFMSIIRNFCSLSDTYSSSGLYEGLNDTQTIISTLVLVYVVVLIVVCLVYFLMGKDLPVAGKISNKIMGVSNDNPKTTEKKKVEKTDKSEKTDKVEKIEKTDKVEKSDKANIE